MKSTSPPGEELQPYMHQIAELRRDGYSWAQLATALGKIGLSVQPSHVKACFRDWNIESSICNAQSVMNKVILHHCAEMNSDDSSAAVPSPEQVYAFFAWLDTTNDPDELTGKHRITT